MGFIDLDIRSAFSECFLLLMILTQLTMTLLILSQTNKQRLQWVLIFWFKLGEFGVESIKASAGGLTLWYGFNSKSRVSE